MTSLMVMFVHNLFTAGKHILSLGSSFTINFKYMQEKIYFVRGHIFALVFFVMYSLPGKLQRKRTFCKFNIEICRYRFVFIYRSRWLRAMNKSKRILFLAWVGPLA